MDINYLIALIFLFIVNLIAFLIMLIDKQKSKTSNERINEGVLFFLAIFFGSIGVYLGMFAFRHKTRKWYFTLGIPFLMVQNIALIILILILIDQINI